MWAAPSGAGRHLPLMTAVDIASLSEVPRSDDFTVEHDSFHTTTEPHARQHCRLQLDTRTHTRSSNSHLPCEPGLPPGLSSFTCCERQTLG